MGFRNRSALGLGRAAETQALQVFVEPGRWAFHWAKLPLSQPIAAEPPSGPHRSTLRNARQKAAFFGAGRRFTRERSLVRNQPCPYRRLGLLVDLRLDP